MRCSATLLPLVFLFALPACSIHYVPKEYPLNEGAVPPIDLAGTVSVANAQPSTASVTVTSNWAGGASFNSDLHAVTEAMVQQTTKEIEKNARKLNGGSAKTIELAVLELKSSYVAFFFRSHIRYTAKLGSGKTIAKEVGHGHADQLSDLNGAIAEGVIELLKDPDLRQYLASP
jgi:peptidoglycan hydrolase-like amidase